MITFGIALCLFFLLGLGTPLYLILVALSALLFTTSDLPLAATVISFKRLEVQEFLSAIPLFTYAGYALSRSAVPARIVKLSTAWLGWFHGSATAVTVMVMALFTALTGASGISILALGALMYPLLNQATRNERFAYGLITGSGSIGLLLAPSLPVIIYGIIANQNASAHGRVELELLFRAALLPTALLLGGYILYGSIIERRSVRTRRLAGASIKNVKFELRPALLALKNTAWELLLPILVYGGIYWGFFTILEAALVAYLYTTLLLFIIRRECKWRRDFIPLTVGSLKLSGGIFIIMASAFILTNYLVNERFPQTLFNALSPYLSNRYIFLIAINIFLLLVGCILDIFSAILIILPLVLPIVERYGINPYHFAIIFLVNLEIGYITPPVGLNLFIASYRFKKDILFIYRATIPFLLILLGILAILSYIPVLSTFTITSAENNNTHQTNSSTHDREAPSRIKTFNISASTATSLSLTFSPARDNTPLPAGTELQYNIVYIDEAMDELELIVDFGESLSIPTKSLKRTNDNLQYTLMHLKPQTTYSLVLLAEDAAGNVSFPSAILTTQTRP